MIPENGASQAPENGMSIVVTGSIATDYLMTFPGRITEQLIEGQLEHVSLSFLVDDLEIRKGGVAADIAFGLGCLGLRPVLVGAVGADFGEYRQWLEMHGVVTEHVLVSATRHTARFLCTTDADSNQIASFYPGAMTEASAIDLGSVISGGSRPELVIICPDDPEAMLRHTRACRAAGQRFAADPSQQLARLDGPKIRTLADGARYLFTNEYERDLLVQKTGWTVPEVLASVGTWITTRGAQGVTIESAGTAAVSVPAAPEHHVADPTGVGDAFRAGFLAGVTWHLDELRSAQIGCLLATLALETVGTQEYRLAAGEFLDRFAEVYGPCAAADLQDKLPAEDDAGQVARAG